MTTNQLSIYVHDHLAGAGAALEMLGKLKAKHRDEPFGGTLEKLHGEISWEREQLEKIAAVFPIGSGTLRRVASAGAELGFQLKLAVDGAGNEAFKLFESLEALSLGIAGKRLLWRILRLAARKNHSLREFDYKTLIAMAVRQRREVELLRLTAAQEADFFGIARTGNEPARGRQSDQDALQ